MVFGCEIYHTKGACKVNKHNAKPTIVDGVRFDSLKEAKRYTELKLLERGGAIRDLELQPRYDVVVNDKKICYYKADFRYFDIDRGVQVVEDVKPMGKSYRKTQAWAMYRLKKKLVEALHPVVIEEV